MTLTVEFLNRDSTERAVWPWERVQVYKFSKSAIGGPKKAILRAFGSAGALWEFIEMLRCPVIITDKERSKSVWWGYINEVTAFIDGEERTATLEGFANSIAVGYTRSGYDYKTTFQTNAESIAEYGTKDLLLTASDRTGVQAKIYVLTELARRKYPVITRPEASNRSNYVDIECLGWYESLDWQYFEEDRGQEIYTELDSWYGREIGEDDRPKCAQSFQILATSAWTADTIWIRIRHAGASTDNVVVRLKADTAGNPAAGDLATCTLADTDIDTYMDWIECTLSTTVTLSASTTYWISVEKSGAIHEDDYYIVDGSSAMAYDRGEFKVYSTNNAQWETWPLEMDMAFRITGVEVTTTQIETIITDTGQFLVDTDIIAASGVSTALYRDGDNTGKFEIEELLLHGTTNNRRLLARVLENRHFEVYEEPVQFNEDYSRNRAGIILDPYDTVVPPSECPVAVWMKFESSMPSSVDTSKLMSGDYIFVEEAEYVPETNEYRVLKTRDTDTLRALFGVVDG